MTEEGLERNFVVRLNAFEAGALLWLVHEAPLLKDVAKQLISLKEDIDRECGVTKELLPDGLLKITNDSGDVMVRSPFPWEKEAEK